MGDYIGETLAHLSLQAQVENFSLLRVFRIARIARCWAVKGR